MAETTEQSISDRQSASSMRAKAAPVGLASTYQRYTMERVARSSIKLHPQNPRIISESAKKKLRGKMKDVGLLQPLIVNRTTGYLLGGHQRLASLDSLEHYKPGKNDYLLDVAMVELDSKAELEMLVFLNNPSGQGHWDLDGLATLALEGGVNFEDMGFDKADVEIMFDGDARFEEFFADSQEVQEAKDALADMHANGGRTKHTGLDEMRDKGARDISTDFYVVVVCKDQGEKDQLLRHLRVPRGEQYISPAEILSLKR